MKKVILFSMVCFGFSLFISSCAKKEGCTNQWAKNYDSGAKSDDGSCTYQASMVCWMTEATSQSYNAAGITSLTYKLDGQVVGTSGTNVFFPSAPSCGANGAVTITKDLGSSVSKTYAGSVTDDQGNEVWTGTVTLSALTPCFKVEILP